MVNPRVKVNVPGLSSFDKSFHNILTTKVGTLTPLVSRIVIPGSKGHMKIAISAALPPLASDTFMRCDLKVEAFLVPMRLLYGGFESFLTGRQLYDYNDQQMHVAAMPRLYVAAYTGGAPAYLQPGTLADYLGIRVASQAQQLTYFNILPFLAYHRIYDDWYRNPKIQVPIFNQPIRENFSGTSFGLGALPYVARESIFNFAFTDAFLDGVKISDLRQRNFGDDYFTIATPSAQTGSAQSISTAGNTFTIASLRAANSLQQFAERSNLASPRLQDYVKAHFGADLNSGVAQRAILLGSASYPVYSKGVEANSGVAATNNPFTSVASRYGTAFASGTDFVCDFEANEPCYLMVMASLVPVANYSSGLRHDMTLFTQAGSQVDLPDPLLENTGNEPVLACELTGDLDDYDSGVIFGYVPKNTFHKSSINEVHGLLRTGQSLESFVACRSLSGVTQISSAFLTIPTTALDNVTAVTASLSTYGCWIDSFVELKVAEPLTESAMPSLQDPAYEHGHSVGFNINGSKL